MTKQNDVLVMEKFSREVVGPVMYEYTFWILSECEKRGLKKVYFLARDGYLLCEIAKVICKKFDLKIECKYLYCSRLSLRIPTYHFLGEEGMDLLLLKSYYATPESVLLRAGLEEKELTKLAKELGINDIHKEFSSAEFEDFANKLRGCEIFKNKVDKISKNAYKSAIDYFKQEKLFEDDKVVIADSGWTGSMQRSLRQLLESAGYKGKFIGFYFGLNKKSNQREDGEYLSYYFSPNENNKRKINFNNNVFECMLSADHGMTVGYRNVGGKSEPVLKAEENNGNMKQLVPLQIDGALEYAQNCDVYKKIGEFDLKKSRKKCYRILKRAMVKPTREEVEMLSNFMFCDDVTEGYHISISSKELRKHLGNEMFVNRALRKLFHKKSKVTTNLFWTYGVIATCPKILRPWYRFNIKLWDWIRFTLKKG